MQRSINWGVRYVNLLSFLWWFVIPSWVISMYLGRIPIETLSYFVDDGWCNPEIRVISSNTFFGVHCFGDFELPNILLNRETIWPPEIPHPYSPIGMIPHVLPNFFLELGVSYNLVKFIYLGCLALAGLIPVIVINMVRESKKNISTLMTLGFASLPLLIALDRGNSSILLTPVVFFACVHYLNGNFNKLAGYIFLASILRPQFIILALFLVASRKIKHFTAVLLSFLSVTIGSFLMWPGDATTNLKSWVRNIINFSSYVPLSNDNPSLSFSQAIWKVTNSLFFFNVFEKINMMVTENTKVLGVSIFMLVFVLILVRDFSSDKSRVLLVVLPLTVLVPGITWAYYLFFAIIVSTLIITVPTYDAKLKKKKYFGGLGIFDNPEFSKLPTLLKNLTLVVASSAVVPIILVLPNKKYSELVLWQGVIWAVYILAIITQYFWNRLKFSSTNSRILADED